MTTDHAVHAVVLAGGRATRLGGVNKALVEINGVPLIDHVLTGVRASAVVGGAVVAVGPESIARPGVTVVRERPAHGGPVAAIAAALSILPDVGDVVVLACDLPRAAAVVALLSDDIADGFDANVLHDPGGVPQWLAGRYRILALRNAIDLLPSADGASMRKVAHSLRVAPVADAYAASLDLDTWDAVTRFRRQNG